jgi:hypothetical protein
LKQWSHPAAIGQLDRRKAGEVGVQFIWLHPIPVIPRRPHVGAAVVAGSASHPSLQFT